MDEIQTNTDIKIAQRTTLFISMFASFVFPFTANSLNIAIPFIGEEFQVPATSLTWVMSAMMLANISINVPIGRFADLWNKRKVFSLGILIFSVAAMLGAFAPNYWTLIVFRVFQGIGGAMFISTNFAILMDVFPANQRGRVLGLSVMCTYLGLSVGPLVGGFFIRYFSWNAIFITTSLLALIVFGVAIISMSKLPKKTAIQPKSISISPASNILYILAMLVFMYGFTVFGQHIYSYFFLATGVILLVIFAHHELKTKYPVI
ncbi:MAG: MFS transporter, partial [Oscillospiraceae bacterium]|nr:MFS transporter [Oscillospiraceae bacterium]